MKSAIWLIGASKIAQDYSKILEALNVPYIVICRSENSASSFKEATGHDVKTGGLKKNLEKNFPNTAIVAVGIDELFEVTKNLINSGTNRILLEKPGSINIEEINELNLLANKKNSKVLIAYNRRFYQSVDKMKKLINEDGEITSMTFEFTEWIDKINPIKRPAKIREHWLIANSHVIDLAFHLGGKPKNWNCWQNGSFEWHPASARFCGSGITEKNVMFSYLSDWKSSGSWKLEFLTTKNRFILKPLEELKVLKIGKTKVEEIKIEDDLDKQFKPGLFLQTKKFINRDDHLLCSLSDQVENMKLLYKIAGY